MADTDRYTLRAYFIPSLLMVLQGKLTDEQMLIVRERAPRVFEAARGDLKGEIPIETFNELVDAVEGLIGIARTHEAIFACAEEGVGPAALNSFLRLVIKFMPPNVFARKCHDFYRRDNMLGTLVLESYDGDARTFVLLMNDVSRYHYGSAMLGGVISCMMKAMGHERVRVADSLHPPPASQVQESYRLVISW